MSSGRLAMLMIGLCVFAFVFRLLYLGQIEDNVFFLDPALDSANYHQKALQIMAGEETAEGVLTYNPLYPVILSVLYRFMSEPDFYAVRVIQSLLGAVNCALILLVGLRFFTFRTGLLAALGALFYGPFLFFDGELIQSTWILFFLLLSFLLLPLDPSRKGISRAALCLLSGILFGVGLLGRPNMILFLFFL